MARAFATVVAPHQLTVIVNVADDDVPYGVHVAADIDTVTYTLADIEGPHGWGIAGDTFHVMTQLEAIGVDTRFRLGDKDLATCLLRTAALNRGTTLSEVTADVARELGVEVNLLPVTNDHLRTKVDIGEGDWIDFQDYFVLRQHRDRIADLRYEGAMRATPAPGVIDTIEDADVVVIAPSNPPLSIWPILAVPGVREAVHDHECVAAVSPLFGGQAVKGPTVEVMTALGLPPGNEGVLAAYPALVNYLIVDTGDAADIETFDQLGVTVLAHDTRLTRGDRGAGLATAILDLTLAHES